MQAQALTRSLVVAEDENGVHDHHNNGCLEQQTHFAAAIKVEVGLAEKKKTETDNDDNEGSVKSAVEDGTDSTDEEGDETPATIAAGADDDGVEEWVDFSVDDGEVVDGEKAIPVNPARKTTGFTASSVSPKKTAWVWRPKKKMSKAQRVIMQHYAARSELIKKKREMMSQCSDGAETAAAPAEVAAGATHAESPIKNLKMVHATVTRWMLREYAGKAAAVARAAEPASDNAKELAVLDVACGRGGDVAKWEEMIKDEEVLLASVDYVGVDVVEGLIEEAKRRRFNNEHVRARFLCEDAYGGGLQEKVRNLLAKSQPQSHPQPCDIDIDAIKDVQVAKEQEKLGLERGIFDICSCQFALHYAWSSEDRARTAMRDIATLLKPGGYFIGSIPDAEAIVAKLGAVVDEHPLREHLATSTTTTTNTTMRNKSPPSPPTKFSFGNSVYRLSFDVPNARRALAARVLNPPIPSSNISSFSPSPFGIQYDVFLADAVLDCPEWLVPLPALQRIGLDYGLQLVFTSNFDHFRLQHQHHHPHQSLFLEYPTPLPLDLECNCLYLMFAFQKL